jgi:hypothetical protein
MRLGADASYAYYTGGVAELHWRMPSGGEPIARLVEVTIPEVAEALEARLRFQLRERLGDEVLAVFSVTAEHRAIAVLLVRDDDPFVWRVAHARPMGASSSRRGSGGQPMNEVPDFTNMTKEEIGEWFLSGDASAIIARAERATEPMTEVDTRGEPVMRPATFRLPQSMIEWLERAAGRDREGKSGIVRKALQEYQERHREAA